VGEKLAPHRNAIYECAIMTFHVDELESSIGFADGEVATRDCAIAQTQMVGGVATDRKLVTGQPYDSPFRRSRNYYNSRVQVGIPQAS
jgi:hypothetical protein